MQGLSSAGQFSDPSTQHPADPLEPACFSLRLVASMGLAQCLSSLLGAVTRTSRIPLAGRRPVLRLLLLIHVSLPGSTASGRPGRTLEGGRGGHRAPLPRLRSRRPLARPGSQGPSNGRQPGGVMGRVPAQARRPGLSAATAPTPRPRPAGASQPRSADTRMPRGSNARGGRQSRGQARPADAHTAGSTAGAPA